MPFHILAVHRAVGLQPFLHQRTVHPIIVYPSLAAGVIRRVDVNAFYPPGVARQQRLERMQVVAFDNHVVFRIAAVGVQQRSCFVQNERTMRHRHMMRINLLLPIKIQLRHIFSYSFVILKQGLSIHCFFFFVFPQETFFSYFISFVIVKFVLQTNNSRHSSKQKENKNNGYP